LLSSYRAVVPLLTRFPHVRYASYIFTYDQKQEEIARKVTQQVQDSISRGTLNCFAGTDVKSKIGGATVFYAAEQEHQDYLAKHPNGYCNHYMRFKEFPQV
jgi:peptide-methionine (S)-S-oxide reductase